MKVYRYVRIRRDGSTNESVSLKSFEKWLREAEDGDQFYVGMTKWVSAQIDGVVEDPGSPAAGVPKVVPGEQMVTIAEAEYKRLVKE